MTEFTSFPEIVERLAADPPGDALIELARDGERRTFSFADVVALAASYSRAFADRGVGRGDVVLSLIGNRPEWVFTMLGCWRMGAVVLPCNEMLRAKDLKLRVDRAAPRLVVADERNRVELEASGWTGETIYIPDEQLAALSPLPPADLAPDDPALMI
ncbi:MAG: AMP-binding protein, partial [Solirubrobacterales bacterium]